MQPVWDGIAALPKSVMSWLMLFGPKFGKERLFLRVISGPGLGWLCEDWTGYGIVEDRMIDRMRTFLWKNMIEEEEEEECCVLL